MRVAWGGGVDRSQETGRGRVVWKVFILEKLRGKKFNKMLL